MSISGKKILITRDNEGNKDWQEKLRSLGAIVRALDCISIHEFDMDNEKLIEIRRIIEASEYVIWTSARGVFYSRKFFNGHNTSKFCAVGIPTANEIKKYFGDPYLISQEMNAKGLSQIIIKNEDLKNKKILLLLAINASDVLEKELQNAGANVKRINIYETKPIMLNDPILLSSLDVDHIFVASPSAAKGLKNNVIFDRSVNVYPIGVTTKKTLDKYQIKTQPIPKSTGLEGLINQINNN